MDDRIYFTLSEILEDPDILKPPKVIIPGLAWEERITLLAAREKGGKSTIMGAGASAVSKGEPFLGVNTEESKVLWVSLEEHISEIARRFDLFGADGENIILANAYVDTFHTIERICEETEPDVIVWDTLGALANAVSPIPIEPGDSAAWTRIMQSIVNISRAHAASVILHHARKSDGKYRDSTAIGANVDVLLEMYGEGTSDRTIKGVGRWQIPELTIRLHDNEFIRVESQRDLENQVYNFIQLNAGCSYNAIANEISGRDQAIRKAVKSLEKKNKISISRVGQTHAHHAIPSLR